MKGQDWKAESRLRLCGCEAEGGTFEECKNCCCRSVWKSKFRGTKKLEAAVLAVCRQRNVTVDDSTLDHGYCYWCKASLCSDILSGIVDGPLSETNLLNEKPILRSREYRQITALFPLFWGTWMEKDAKERWL